MSDRQQWIFAIAAKPFTETSAGIKAKYILRELLIDFGFNAYIVPIGRRRLFEPSHLIHKKAICKPNLISIAIYDESIFGNPLKADIVIRWFLNRPGAIYSAGNFDRKNENQYVFAQEINNNLNLLTVNTVDFDFFRPEGSCSRTISLFYAGKKRAIGVDFRLPKDVIEIHRNGKNKQSREELRDLLQQSRVLYLAEDSAIALEAAIAGCPIVYLNEFFTKPKFNSNLEIGVANSDSKEDLQLASLSLEQIDEYEKALFLRSYQSIAAMITDLILTRPNTPHGQLKLRMPWISIQRSRVNLIVNALKNNGIKGIISTLNSFLANRSLN